MDGATRGSPGGSRAGALVLLLGGVLFVGMNVGLAPLLPMEADFAGVASSPVFLWRQSIASIATLLLLGGSVALHARQAARSGAFGKLAFAAAFAGTACVFAWEWSQVFVVRDAALRAPAALEALENAGGMTLFDVGALIAVSGFTLGWLAFAASMLATRVLPRLGPALLIAGFFGVALLGAALPGIWGMVAGNVVLGAGWIVLGAALFRDPGPGA